jgi:phage repressor protein C with HTH and peptisase S24 domain
MSALAEKANIGFDQVRNFYKGTNTGIKSVAAMLEAVGARVQWPDERQDVTREVVFANPKLVNVPNCAPPPEAHNYLAVPLVGWSGAGGGVHDPIDLDGNYLMVLRNHPSIRTRSDLIGVKIARWETSMSPLMNPGDIIVVDRRDIYDDPSPPGNIYLVRDPATPGSVMIKRVIFQESLKGNLDIVFYSENASKHPPMVHNYEHVFSSDIENAIVGRVVVCFSDMTDK